VDLLVSEAEKTLNWLQSLLEPDRTRAAMEIVRQRIGSATRLTATDKAKLFDAYKEAPPTVEGTDTKTDPNAHAKAVMRRLLALDTP
jgi:hypothetical protein